MLCLHESGCRSCSRRLSSQAGVRDTSPHVRRVGLPHRRPGSDHFTRIGTLRLGDLDTTSTMHRRSGSLCAMLSPPDGGRLHAQTVRFSLSRNTCRAARPTGTSGCNTVRFAASPSAARLATDRSREVGHGPGRPRSQLHARADRLLTVARRVFRFAGREWPDPRNTRAWRTLRDQVVREEPICRLRIVGVCTTASTTADHIIPIAQRPDLGMERANLRGACKACNEHRNHLTRRRRTTRSPRRAPTPPPGPQPNALRFFD